MFNFTPLLGAQSSSPASQSLLELDGGVKILVDVGWDEEFDVEKLKELERQLPTLSLILLTHATTAHLAAFAHCCKHFPLFTRVPVYATTPVINLGKTLLQDLYASTPLASSVIPQAALSESSYSFPVAQNGASPNILLQPPTAEEINGYFQLIHPLKYSQPHRPVPSPFSPPLNELTITAYSAGHTLGGTIWHIQHGLESIVYAVDWNQAREHILSGAAWLGGAGSGAEVIEQLRRPTALICSSRGAERVTLAGGRKRRDEVLLEMIEETISKGGTVLIPSDSSARVLELAYLLESAWVNKKEVEGSQVFKDAKLYLASRTAGPTMRYARSLLEWMAESIDREFQAAADANVRGNRSNQRGHQRQTSKNNMNQDDDDEESRQVNAPFEFKHMKLLGRRAQIERMLSTRSAKVIIASDTSLEWGFSKDVLQSIANDNRNLVVLTDRIGQISTTRKSLGRQIWELYESKKPAADGTTEEEQARVIESQGHDIELQKIHTSALEGSEVAMYQQYQARKRQLQNTMQTDRGTTLEASADLADDRSSTTSESSDDEDDDQQGKLLNISAAMSHARNKLGLSDAEMGINVLLRKKGAHDFDVRGKKGRDKVFPFAPKRKRNDEFGDIIRPEEYLRAEERDDVEGEELRDGVAKGESTVGQKRKWDETTRRAGTGANGPGKRRKSDTDGGVDADDDGDSSDTDEPEDDKAEAGHEGPLKVTFSQERVQVHFRIAFVDFSGLHDKRSLQMLIPLIRPRKLILVGGEENETQALAADCLKLLQSGLAETSTDVFTPIIGRTIDASVDTNAWIVKLSQSFFKRLKWQEVRGLGVVAVTGRLEASKPIDDAGADGARKRPKTTKPDPDGPLELDANMPGHNKLEAAPVLDVVPSSMAAATRSVAQPLHVGDLRLADLRKILQSAGHTAEFRGEGTLLIDGTIAVRKSGTGKIDVEGGLSLHGPKQPDASFYAVRKKIYDGLALVAGG